MIIFRAHFFWLSSLSSGVFRENFWSVIHLVPTMPVYSTFYANTLRLFSSSKSALFFRDHFAVLYLLGHEPLLGSWLGTWQGKKHKFWEGHKISKKSPNLDLTDLNSCSILKLQWIGIRGGGVWEYCEDSARNCQHLIFALSWLD